MKGSIIVITAALLLTAVISGISFAEDYALKKIVVTPSRTEQSYDYSSQQVDFISANDIESSNARDLSNVLEDINSLVISDQGGLGQQKSIRMRGSTSAQTLVLIDGRPINNPRDGSVDLSMIPLDNIARVEIVHGPGSSIYGSSAMAGTVNIITKSPPKEKQKTQVLSSFGTFHTYTEQFSHGARLGDLGYIFSGSYISSEGYRTNSQLSQKDFNGKFEYKADDKNNLFFNAGFFKNRIGAPGSIFYPDIDDKQVTLKNFLDLGWIFKPDSLTEFKSRVYNNYEKMIFNPNTLDNPIFEFSTVTSVHTTKVRGLSLQADREVSGNYRIISGMDYVANLNDSTETAKHKYSVLAWFMENQLDILNDLKVLLNIRIDDYSNFGTQANPSVGIIYKLKNNNKLHATISRSFRAPTFNDLYWSSPGMIGNPDLRPEKGLTGEIGVEANLNRQISFEINYYRSKYSELIQWAPLTADPASDWTVKNIGSALIDGIEFSNKIYLSPAWEADLGYSFLVAKDDKLNKYLIYQPKNKADFTLKYSGLKGLSFKIRGMYVDSRFGDSDNTLKVKRYYTINLDASKKIKAGLTYYISIDNLLGRKYQPVRGFPVPGFSLTNGIKLEF